MRQQVQTCLINKTTAATTTGSAITIDLTQNSVQPKYALVDAGQTKFYDLNATVGSFTTGSALSVYLAQDTSALGVNQAATGGASGNVVWSDRSGVAGSHTTATADWTNGYLLKNFTTNSVNYSK